jgi:uncharacterized protein involved in outer membrane biogenesis
MKLLKRLAWALGLLVVVVVAAQLALPPWLKRQAEARASGLLGRPVTIAALDLVPWRLALTLTGLRVGPPPARPEAAPTLLLDRVVVQADIASLWQRTLMLQVLSLDGLRLQLTRAADGQLDIDDLLARLAGPGAASAAPSAAAAPPSSQALPVVLRQLQLRDGSLRLDDRLAGRVHTLDRLNLVRRSRWRRA